MIKIHNLHIRTHFGIYFPLFESRWLMALQKSNFTIYQLINKKRSHRDTKLVGVIKEVSYLLSQICMFGASTYVV